MKKILPITLITAGVAAVAGVLVYKKFCENNEECKITKLVNDIKAKNKKAKEEEDVVVEDEGYITLKENVCEDCDGDCTCNEKCDCECDCKDCDTEATEEDFVAPEKE